MKNLKKTITASVLCLAFVAAAYGQTTEFTFQGRFSDLTTTQPTNGTYQMQFALFDAVGAGNQIGSTLNIATVQVTNGIFTVSLNFGTGAFSGPARFLQISVFSQTSSTFVPLSPRQPLTSSPYAIKALNADTAVAADDAANLDGIPADQYVQTTDPRMINDRNPTPGSGNYIQNRTTPQTATNFNVEGNGTVGGTLTGDVVNSNSQYNIGNSRVLSTFGSNNTFTGFGTGPTNTGANNSFFGRSAGFDNTTGSQNAFVGSFAGANNTTGSENSFIGSGAGDTNTTGNLNSFFGRSAGSANTTGSSNTFMGRESGLENTTGFFNTFVGRNTGDENTTGFQNTFVGANAGSGNLVGSSNTAIGYNASIANGATNSTAIGAGAVATNSNTMVFGSTSVNRITLGGNTTDVQVPGGMTYLRVTNIDVSDTVDTNELFLRSVVGTGHDDICLDSVVRNITRCASSIRFKKNIENFTPGMDIVNRLRPVTFDWKSDGTHDLGLIAEEVAAVEPLLATHLNGQTQGVKYDRIGVVLLNAVKEQQTQIESLKLQIEALKRMVCEVSTQSEFCK